MKNTNWLSKWTAQEKKILQKLNDPWKIQKFLYSLPYHLADTAYSPRLVLREKTAHCFEGAVFAAAALRFHGYPPLILDLEAHNDTDHVICVFKKNNCWGAIASSNYPNCRYRPPVYKSLRELAMSYFNDYFNDKKQRTMRTYSRPVSLTRFDSLDWAHTEEPIWFIAEHLCEIPHTQLLTKAMKSSLTPIDERSYAAGTFGRRK